MPIAQLAGSDNSHFFHPSMNIERRTALKTIRIDGGAPHEPL
jgi:hypothetical protein